jgi:Arc/MetJ family transcription regulator
MKMTMHIDEDTLREVMKITGAPSKTAAVEMALKELARKAKLKALLKRGLGLKPEELKKTFPPDYLETYRAMPGVGFAVAEEQAVYGKRRSRR